MNTILGVEIFNIINHTINCDSCNEINVSVPLIPGMSQYTDTGTGIIIYRIGIG